jgi:hypothetical protein
MEMRKSGTGDEMRCSGERMRWRWRGGEMGCQAVTGGASSKCRLWKRRRGGSHLMRGNEGGGTLVRFSSIWVREGGTRWRLARWRTGRGGGGSGVRRWEKTPSGPTWARGRRGLGCAGQVATRPKGLFRLKVREKGKWAAGLFFPIFQTKI